jgi:hypothetical protein
MRQHGSIIIAPFDQNQNAAHSSFDDLHSAPVRICEAKRLVAAAGAGFLANSLHFRSAPPCSYKPQCSANEC